MTLQEITQCMQAYANLRNTEKTQEMQSLYNQGNAFPYVRDNNNQPVAGGNKAYVNAYPGIKTDGSLVFFVISAYKDVSSNPSILNDIQIIPIQNLTPSATGSTGNISPQEANIRIANWASQRNPWIQANIETIFQCYSIPQEDSSSGTTHNAFLALNQNSAAKGGYIADAIVEDVENSTFIYYDNVHPVPPFPPATGTYYLLSLV